MNSHRLALLLLAIASATAWCADPDDLPMSENVVPELVATGFAPADGLAVDPHGNLFVANYRSPGNIGRITPDGTASVWCELSRVAPLEGRTPRACGLKVDHLDRLIVADAEGRLLRISAAGNSGQVLADRFEGARFKSVQAVALDADRNIYFTVPGTTAQGEPAGAVFVYAVANNAVHRLADGLLDPSGLAVSPDQRRLCVAENGRQRMLALRMDNPSATPVEVLCEFPAAAGQTPGAPASVLGGVVFDSLGRLYVARPDLGAIDVVDLASGQRLRRYHGGGDRVTDCHFHGQQLLTAVAAKEAVFRLPLGVTGYDYRQR